MKDVFVRTRLPTINKKINRRINRAAIRFLRAGQHPQQWRPNFGPAGWFDDMIILRIDIERDRYISLGIQGFSIHDLENLIVRKIIAPLVQKLHYEIEFVVPKDTGKLRKAMHKALSNDGASNLYSFPFTVILNTGELIYSKPVNEMPTKWLAHPHWTRSNPNKTLHQLYDPKAKHNWFNIVLLHGRTLAKRLTQQFFRLYSKRIVGGLGQLFGYTNDYRLFRSLFHVKFNNIGVERW